MLEALLADSLFVIKRNAFYDMISELGLTFTLNDRNPPVPLWLVHQLQLFHVWQIIMSAKTFQVGRDNPDKQ